MKRLLFFLLTIIPCLLVSCEPQEVEQDLYSAESFLKDRYDLNPLGDTIRFTVSTIGNWSLSKPTWLDANRTTGRGLTTVILTANANVTGSTLSGEIHIYANENKTIIVSQANPFAFLEDNNPSEYKWDKSIVGDSESQSKISVASNLYWRLEPLDTLPRHFKLSPSEGFSESNVIVECIENNLDTLDRIEQYKLVSYIDEGRTRPVSDISGIREDTVSIRQGHFHFTVNNLSKANAIYGKGELAEKTFEINIESDPGQSSSWSVKEIPDWLNVTKVDNQHLKLWPRSTNVTKNDRRFDLTLVASPSGAERVIEVVQEKYNFYFIVDGIEIKSDEKVAVRNAGDTTITAHFVSSGPWKILSQPKQLQCTPTSGSEGDTQISITVPGQNFSKSELNLPLTIQSNDSKFLTIPLEETLSLAQRAFKFEPVNDGLLDTLPSSKGNTKYIDFISSGPLSVSEKPSWTDVYFSSIGDQEYRVNVMANSDNSSETAHRTGKISLVCTGHDSDLKYTFNVVQMRSLFDLLSESTVSSVAAYDNPAPTFRISLLTSQSWSVDNNNTSNWITLNPSSGDGKTSTTEITCNLANNPGKARSGKVVIRNSSGATKQINVSQEGFFFSAPKVDFKSAVGGDLHQVELSCYGKVPWSVDSYPSWIYVSPTSGNGSTRIAFQVNGNGSSSNERSGTATIRNGFTGDVITVSFKQPGYSWEVNNADSYSFDAFKGDSSPEFTLTASGNWSIRTPAWLEASTSQGTGGRTYRIKFTTALDNAPANSARSDIVTIVCEDFNTLNKTISVSQKNYRLESNPASLTLPRKKSETTIMITADGQWIATTDQSWITLSKKSGASGATSVKVTCERARTDRQGYIIVKDTKHPSVEVKIMVSQKK